MRSNRTAAIYFDDMLTAIVRLNRYTYGITFEALEADVEKQDAICYRLLILTEAAHCLKPDEEALCPSQDWPKICSLGNILRHDYDAVDLHMIWQILQDDLPPLQEAIELTMREHFPEVPRSS
jgi:uncharacterized protein with HEPN domain